MNNELKIWCMHCREKHRILNPFIYHLKKNKLNGVEGICALQGACEKCGNKVSRILPREYSNRSLEYIIEQLTNKQNNV